jgi:DNA-binding beta-propeller fold protein YncE
VGASSGNPQQIAILRWYGANQTGIEYAVAFPPQPHPALTDMAFDGSSLWLTDVNSQTVVKLSVADGTTLGRFPLPSGNPLDPNGNGLVCDGFAIWVGNPFANTVTRLRLSDGTNLGSFPVPGNPWRLAFDGVSIWVASRSGQVTRLRVSDGMPLGGFTIPGPVNGLAFDGANLWLSSQGFVARMSTALPGSTLPPLQFPVGGPTAGMAFDGANIWVLTQQPPNPVVIKLRASDGAILGTFPVGPSVPTGSPQLMPNNAIAFDGTNLWVTTPIFGSQQNVLPWLQNPDPEAGAVTKLRASEGTRLGMFPVGHTPLGIAFDGVNIWVANQGSGTVSKL